MKVFEPLSTYSSPSLRAVDFIEPNASEPESGSVMAQAPILSMVSRSGTQRSFWAMVPLELMAAEVRPIDTPMAVTMPGQTRHSSMMGISVSDEAPPSPSRSGFSGGVSPGLDGRGDLLLELHLLGEAVAGRRSMPKSRTACGGRRRAGVSPCSNSSIRGRISLSMNWRTASRTISCSSLHLYTAAPLGRTGGHGHARST